MCQDHIVVTIIQERKKVKINLGTKAFGANAIQYMSGCPSAKIFVCLILKQFTKRSTVDLYSEGKSINSNLYINSYSYSPMVYMEILVHR